MCVCVTRRLSVQQMVLSVAYDWLQRHGPVFGTPQFVEHVNRVPVETSILILDLPSLGASDTTLQAAQRWRSARKAGTLIVVVDVKEHLETLEAYVRLGALVVWADKVFSRDHWQAKLEERTEGVIAGELCGEVGKRVGMYRLPNDVDVLLTLLELAPRAAATRVVELPLMRETLQRVHATKLSTVLRENYHPPARQVLALFQVLWLMRLRAAGWTPDETAQLLRFGVARTQIRYFNRTIQLHMRDLLMLGYPEVLKWVCETLVTRWPADVTWAEVTEPLRTRVRVLGATAQLIDGPSILAVGRVTTDLLRLR